MAAEFLDFAQKQCWPTTDEGLLHALAHYGDGDVGPRR